MRLVISIIIPFLVSCASLPPPPIGDTCIIDIDNNDAVCVPISSAIQREHVTAADGTHYIWIRDMDGYVAFSPDTWGSIEAYILKLKDRAQQSCGNN